MSFQSDLLPGEYDQLLALGDEQGNLHVFDVPLPLRKAKASDIDTFKAFIQAEIDWEVKSQERMAAQKEAAENAKAAAPAEGEAAEQTQAIGLGFAPIKTVKTETVDHLPGLETDVDLTVKKEQGDAGSPGSPKNMVKNEQGQVVAEPADDTAPAVKREKMEEVKSSGILADTIL